MSKLFPRFLIAAVAMTSLIALLTMLWSAVAAPPALAQSATPAAATAVPTPTPAPGGGVISSGPDILWLVALTFLGTLALWAILFYYTGWIQSLYFETTAKLAQRGFAAAPTTVGSAPFVSPDIEEGAQPPEPIRPVIQGPSVTEVGQLSKAFTATREDQPGTTVEAEWSVEPPNAAVVTPGKGANVKVLAAIPGAFTLKATAGNPPASAAVQVAAIASQSNKVELPSFGRGYGSIAVTIVLLAIVLILGLTGILPSAAIATLLGGLLGYIFQARGLAPASTSTSERKDEG